MSILKPIPELTSSDVWIEKIKSEWSQYTNAVTILAGGDEGVYLEHLTESNAWDWFRTILMTNFSGQLQWLEKAVLLGVPIDRRWHKVETGHQVTIFDLVDSTSGGIRVETKQAITALRKIYSILFIRKDVQAALDILNDLEEGKHWIRLNIILSAHVLGPLQNARPMLHYVVMMERYDLARGLLASATALQKEFDSDTFLDGWMNMVDEEGRTVLHLTAMQRRESWAKWFLSNHADPSARDMYGKTASHYAPCLPYVEVFFENTREGVKILNEILSNGCEDLDTLKFALGKGATVSDGDTLQKYLQDGAFFRALVDAGTDPSLISPTPSWSTENTLTWLECHGVCEVGYSSLIMKHLTMHKTSDWLCMLSCLKNRHIDEALIWWDMCDTKQLATFCERMKRIKPSTTTMDNYKRDLEKLENMCRKDYINETVNNNDE